MNTYFPLKAQDAIIGEVIIYPEMDMSRTGRGNNFNPDLSGNNFTPEQ